MALNALQGGEHEFFRGDVTETIDRLRDQNVDLT